MYFLDFNTFCIDFKSYPIVYKSRAHKYYRTSPYSDRRLDMNNKVIDSKVQSKSIVANTDESDPSVKRCAVQGSGSGQPSDVSLLRILSSLVLN